MQRCLALLLCTLLAGCIYPQRISERLAIGFGLVRSPLTVQTPEANVCLEPEQRRLLDRVIEGSDEPEWSRSKAADAFEKGFENGVRQRLCHQITLHPWYYQDHIDTHEDLDRDETLFLIALSGGGSRASRLAAHTLAELEVEYNRAVSANGRPAPPFLCRIHGFSTVSGGSIYAAHVGYRLVDLLDGREFDTVCDAATADRATHDRIWGFFGELVTSIDGGTRHLGGYSALVYLNPLTLMALPILTLTSDRTFLDVLAHGTNVLNWQMYPERLLGELPERPRFLFNSLSLESGAPVVLTQRIQHLPSPLEAPWRARLDLGVSGAAQRLRPLRHSLTLEDLNSSPARFPLAYAALASAAFPPVIPPLEISRYGFDRSSNRMYSTDLIHLTDGGVYDNSGLSSAVDLFEHSVAVASEQRRSGERALKRLILLGINAETSIAETVSPDDVRPRRSQWSLGLNLPLRLGGAAAIDQIHFANKRRSEQLAWLRLEELMRHAGRETDVDILYFPVNLTQLSALDPETIHGGPETFARVREIPTDLVISRDNDLLLSGAAHLILSTRQDVGWPVGPDLAPVHTLGSALAGSLIRAHTNEWDGRRPLSEQLRRAEREASR